MIGQQAENNQLPDEIKPVFHELKVLKHLRKAGITKKFGFSCRYLFQLVFVLIFHHRNWFQLLEIARGASFPGKDAVYRFLMLLRIRMAAVPVVTQCGIRQQNGFPDLQKACQCIRCRRFHVWTKSKQICGTLGEIQGPRPKLLLQRLSYADAWLVGWTHVYSGRFLSAQFR